MEAERKKLAELKINQKTTEPEISPSILKFGIHKDNLDDFRTALQNPCYLYINLKNGSKYTYAIDEECANSVRMGVRLAVAAGLGGKALDEMTKYPLDLYTVESVLHEILSRRSGRTLEAIIIHIDEYQEYISSTQSVGGRTYEEARKFFKDMLSPIGQVMSTSTNKHFFTIPVCTGTSAIDLHFIHSDYGKRAIQLRPLDYDSAIQMFRDKYACSPHLETVECLSQFQVALHDTGFIPIYIDLLLKVGTFSADYDWGNALFSWVCSKYLSDTRAYWSPDDDIRAIISLGLTKLVITREYVLPGGKTIGEVERAGLIYLSQANSQNIHDVTIVMPFLLLKMLNQRLSKPVIPNDLLILSTIFRPWKWSDFENLIPYYQKAITEALISTD
ncbi:hypothetical protein BGZ76_004619 [Entomortierella beljakovae]|nr:hypothetical protein BGZ76_004619 [Entomortierella beljakovae]